MREKVKRSKLVKTVHGLALGLALLGRPLFCKAAEEDALGTSLSAAQERDLILQAMQQELGRSQAKLKLKGFETPYFICYQLRDVDQLVLDASYGALRDWSTRERNRTARVEVRVGSYEVDNTRVEETRGGHRAAHYDNDLQALRTDFWQLSDQEFKTASVAYYNKKAYLESRPLEADRPADFTHESPTVQVEEFAAWQAPVDEWASRVRQASAVMKEYDWLNDGRVELSAFNARHYLTNSEGSKVATESRGAVLTLWLAAQSADGTPLSQESNEYYADFSQVPPARAIQAKLKELAQALQRLRHAPAQETFNGPAIFSGQAAGVLLHQVLGHLLEGARQKDEREAAALKDKVGESIMPGFLSIFDDPGLASSQGQWLWGSYQVDDEGVPAQKVALVVNGVLKNYLMSRMPLKGFSHSNGHGRADANHDPAGRIGNLVLESQYTYSDEDLKKQLMKECRRQGKAYGLYFKRILGGERGSSKSDNYKTFRGEPLEVYRVDASNGEMKLVRDIEIVGTPLNLLNKIKATGAQPEAFNDNCNSNDSWVHISTLCPSLLISEVEVQKRDVSKARPMVLPPPFLDGHAGGEREER